MTVSSTESRWDYVQTGTQDSFDYGCEIYLKTDLKVYVDGVLQEVDTHYIVTGSPPLYGINNPDGGNIVFYPDYIPAVGAPIAILLDLPLTQLTDFKEGDKLPAETLEKGFDRLVKIAHSFNNILGRILKVPAWSALSNVLVEIKAGWYLRWNAEGTSIICDSGTTIGPHGESHEKDGADKINVDGLLGVLADPQPPITDDIIDLVYPIGSIYISTINTNPGTLFGIGTWIAFGTGRVLIGIDPSQAEFDTVLEEGGAKTVSIAHTHAGPSHTHTGPNHTHDIATSGEINYEAGDDILSIGGMLVVKGAGGAANPKATSSTTSAGTGATGASGTGNTGGMSANETPSTIQPYIVVYMWRRTG